MDNHIEDDAGEVDWDTLGKILSAHILGEVNQLSIICANLTSHIHQSCEYCVVSGGTLMNHKFSK